MESQGVAGILATRRARRAARQAIPLYHETWYMERHGRKVRDNGYQIVPIPPGAKRPGIRGWPLVEATPQLIAKWVAATGRSIDGMGIGIVTTRTPVLDVDCQDGPFIREFMLRICSEFDNPPLRFGNMPKMALLFRTLEPFKTEVSHSYIDSKGRRAQLEILGDRRQFVAFAIHPDTKKPYKWIGESPLTTRAEDLPVLTAEMRQRAIAVFEEMCGARGWQLKARSKGVQRGLAEQGSDNINGGPKDRLGLTPEELRELVMAIPNDDAPYDTAELSWLNVEASIHHESGGADWGFAIGEEWSLLSGKHNSHIDQPNKFEDTWKSFKSDHPNPRTARSLVKLAREHDPNFWTTREIGEVDDAFKATAEPEPAKRRCILIVAGEHPRVVDESEAALIAAGVPFYPRSDKIVRPIVDIVPAHGEGATTTIARLHAISVDGLVDTLARVASYQQYDGRAKKVLTTNPPRTIAQQYLARVGEWKLPRLAGIITTPTLRPDGSVLAVAGYDAATALLLVNPPAMPAMPDKPTREDALAALTLLKGVLAEFKFTDEASRAVALSGMLTPLVRGAVPVAPLHASSAPSFGSGKSYLWDVCGALSIGARCPVIAAGRNDEETEKRLSSILMTGQPIISIDNVSDALGGDFLAQAISQPRLQVRILGKSEAPEVESRTTMYASGINLRVRADMVRRTIRAAMDMEEERPELHEYAGNPFKAILAERGRYLAAGLTAVRAYIVAGRPGLPSPLNGFEEWSATVRAALLWLDCADPIATIEESRIDDPETEQLRAVVCAWRVIAKDSERLTSTQMLGRDGDDLTEVVQTLPGLTSDSVKLGNWLKGKKGRIIDDIAIRGDYNTHKKVWEWHWHELNPL